MEVVAATPRYQLLLIMLMAVMLLPGMKVSPLLVRRKIARTIELQETIGKGAAWSPNCPGYQIRSWRFILCKAVERLKSDVCAHERKCQQRPYIPNPPEMDLTNS
ncbi:hypothetical protein STEG23_035460, partial [Scotinomys teguina]